MYLSSTAILVAGASVAHAFSDTSPFVLFSTAKCVILLLLRFEFRLGSTDAPVDFPLSTPALNSSRPIAR